MSTISDRKLDANRQNALKSTGPRTDTGKTKSAQNARKHDVFCKNLVAPGEDPSDFLFFKRDMLLSLNPATCLELELAEQIVADRWRIKRIHAAEQAAFKRLQEHQRKQHESMINFHRKFPEEMGRYVANASDPNSEYSKSFPKLHEEYKRMYSRQTQILRGELEFIPETGAELLSRSMATDQEIERLSKYEERLQRSVFRAMKELRELKKQEWPGELSHLTIFLRNQIQDELDLTDGIVENEPTETATADTAEGSEQTEIAATSSNTPEDRAMSPLNRDVPEGERLISPSEPREAARRGL